MTTQQDCCNTGSGFYQHNLSPFPTSTDPSTIAAFPMRHRNQQPGMGQEKLKGPRTVPQYGGLDRPKCAIWQPWGHALWSHLTQHHSSSHRMAIPAGQQGLFPLGEKESHWEWLQAPPLPTCGGTKPPPTLLQVL